MTNTIHHRPTIDPRPLLSTRQAAALLGVSKSFLDKSRVKGDGPGFRKMGRRVAYTVSDIDRWLDARAFSSTSNNGGR